MNSPSVGGALGYPKSHGFHEKAIESRGGRADRSPEDGTGQLEPLANWVELSLDGGRTRVGQRYLGRARLVSNKVIQAALATSLSTEYSLPELVAHTLVVVWLL